MSNNKENIKGKCKSRIPVVHPERKKQKTEARCPLGTLSHHDSQDNCVAGPSTSNTLDTTHYVTFRENKNQKLDWTFSVFTDDEKEENSKKTPGGNVDDKAIVNHESSAPTMDVVLKPPPEVPVSKNEINRMFKKPIPLTSKNQEPALFLSAEFFDPDKYAMENFHYLQASEQKLTQEESYTGNASGTRVNMTQKCHQCQEPMGLAHDDSTGWDPEDLFCFECFACTAKR